MIFLKNCLYLAFFITILACDSNHETEIVLCYSNPEITINDACVVNNTLSFASGNTWTSGLNHIVDPTQCDSSTLLSVNALLAVDYDGESVYSVGMNNNIWRNQDFLWQEFIIDSNLVMRDIEVLDDQIILAGGLSFFLGYVQIVDKHNFKPLNTKRFEQQINAVICSADGKCILTGYGVIYFSDNQGLDWGLLEHPGDHFLACVKDQNDHFYILGSSGKVFKTSDGQTVESIRNGSGIAGDYRDIVYNSDIGLVIVGEKGKIEIYDFLSKSWTSRSIDKQHDILSVEVLDNEIFVGTRQGEILKFKF